MRISQPPEERQHILGPERRIDPDGRPLSCGYQTPPRSNGARLLPGGIVRPSRPATVRERPLVRGGHVSAPEARYLHPARPPESRLHRLKLRVCPGPTLLG